MNTNYPKMKYKGLAAAALHVLQIKSKPKDLNGTIYLSGLFSAELC